MDPSVADEGDLLATDPALDMFDERNGPPYPEAFIARYREGQERRNHRITEWARREIERLGAAGAYDRTFNVYRTWADLRFLDLGIDPSERPAGCYLGDPRRANYGPWGLAGVTTCRTWLSMWSLSTSGCRGAPNLARVTCPALVVQSTADQGCYPSDARAIHDALASSDKTLEFVPGDHYLLDPPGARDDVADLIADWIRSRVI
jgi:pimeloyl-ACP methyl ester carboxylesterase